MGNIKDLDNLGSSKFCSGVPMGFQKCRESVQREGGAAIALFQACSQPKQGPSRYRYFPTLDAPGGPGWDPKSMHRYREMFRVAGDYTFNQPRVQRVTARTRPDKSKVVNLNNRRPGFRVEGRARRYYPDGADAVLFGMLAEECNWK